MKRIFMLLAPLALMLVAAMALSGVAQAGGKTSSLLCQQEAASLGISGSYNFIGGSDTKNDNFSHKGTKGKDVFCGFGGNDSIYTLAEGDIFIGGAGQDTVGTLNDPVSGNYGTFYGGADNDSVSSYNYGTFYGGAGEDSVYTNRGTFNGDSGDDSVINYSLGTFNGGDGNDSVNLNEETGIFNGGAGNDTVYDNYGTFNGGADDDTLGGDNVGPFYGENLGTFNGGDGNDTVQWNTSSGTFNGEAGDDSALFNYGIFNGGDGTDSVTTNGGTIDSVEVGV